ncbi:hypothetical protein RYX36_010094 [Vicia faba]
MTSVIAPPPFRPSSLFVSEPQRHRLKLISPLKLNLLYFTTGALVAPHSDDYARSPSLNLLQTYLCLNWAAMAWSYRSNLGDGHDGKIWKTKITILLGVKRPRMTFFCDACIDLKG